MNLYRKLYYNNFVFVLVLKMESERYNGMFLISQSLLKIFDNDVDVYWISKGIFGCLILWHDSIQISIENAMILLKKEDSSLYRYGIIFFLIVFMNLFQKQCWMFLCVHNVNSIQYIVIDSICSCLMCIFIPLAHLLYESQAAYKFFQTVLINLITIPDY